MHKNNIFGIVHLDFFQNQRVTQASGSGSALQIRIRIQQLNLLRI
jgi:hypothetical protein